MELWLWVCICILICIIFFLLMKIYLMKKAAKEIQQEFADRLITETNTLIDISSSDKHMRKLAHSINIELLKLQRERHKFQQGDVELKNAITNISHDLRTPLTAISGYIELLEHEEKSEEVTRYIDIIKNRTEALKELTQELFRYSIILSSGNSLEIESVSINHVLEESIASLYSTLREHNINPSIHIPKVQVIGMLSRSSLSRVFSNLLSNAIKYSDKDLEITLYETGEIVFKNTALELNEIQVGRLFDRFYTVSSARQSTGLGLAIARTLVEQMHGTIYAKYKDNRLSIHIKLPIDTSK